MGQNSVQRGTGDAGTCQDRKMKKTPPKNRAKSGQVRAVIDPHLDFLATSGLGPRWRLLAASVKHVDCPTCSAAVASPCAGPIGTRAPTCPARLYAWAAKRRREQAHPAKFIAAGLELRANPGDADVLRRAILCGIVRLEVDPAGARWVDA